MTSERHTKVALVQPTNKPTAKVAAVGVSGAAVLVLVYVLSLLGLDLPTGVGEAIILVVMFVAGWLKKEVLDKRWGPATPAGAPVAPPAEPGSPVA